MQVVGFAGIQGVPLDRTVAQVGFLCMACYQPVQYVPCNQQLTTRSMLHVCPLLLHMYLKPAGWPSNSSAVFSILYTVRHCLLV